MKMPGRCLLPSTRSHAGIIPARRARGVKLAGTRFRADGQYPGEQQHREAGMAELIFSPRTYRYIGSVIDGSHTRESSALITTRFTSTSPHHPRPGFGQPQWNCIVQVAASGS
jgi:hypothetical protein